MKKLVISAMGILFPIFLVAQHTSSVSKDYQKHHISFTTGAKLFQVNGSYDQVFRINTTGNENQYKSTGKGKMFTPNGFEINLAYTYYPVSFLGIKASVGYQGFAFDEHSYEGTHIISQGGSFVQSDNWNVYSFMAGPTFCLRESKVRINVMGLLGYSISQIPNVDVLSYSDFSVLNLNDETSGAFAWKFSADIEIDIAKSWCLSATVLEYSATQPYFSTHNYTTENGEKIFKKTKYNIESFSFIIPFPKVGLTYKF
ncbi:MAG: hypothetical protein LBR81_01980 [Prevotellaceae bacterium]|jgi:hypothetical protein|nr:hypothetical protein [Prevotellaceae bacterium]